MRVIFMGTPSFASPILDAVLSMGHEVIGVYTRPGKPQGRGQYVGESGIKSYASLLKLPVFEPASLRDGSTHTELESLNSDMIIVAAYGRILPPEVLKSPVYGCINVHPSLLPRHRGPSPVATAIMEGEEIAGVTIMLLDEGLDTGPILASESMQIPAHSTTGKLTEILFNMGAQVLKEALPKYLSGELIPTAQDSEMATFTEMIKKTDGSANWNMSSEQLYRRCRALSPWPGLHTKWKGQILKILESCPIRHTDAELLEPVTGEVIATHNEKFPLGIVTEDGILGISKLQRAGRNITSAAAFITGYPSFVGAILPS